MRTNIYWRRLTAIVPALAAILLPFDTPTALAEPSSPSLREIQSQIQALPEATIYVAKRIITMDPRRSNGEAVAVIGDRILAVGALDDLKHATGDRPFVLDETFKNKVLVPGFIDPQVYPMLAALTLTAEVIAIEDWFMPDGTRPGVRDREGYLTRLAQAHARLSEPSALLLTWGYFQPIHGPLSRMDLDAISDTRPIIVWHRSSRAFTLNSVALDRYKVTEEYLAKQSSDAQAQSNLVKGHFWEQGAFALLPLIAPAFATPERMHRGLDFVETYLHASGITTIAAPGDIPSHPVQAVQNRVLGDHGTPFRTFFIADGKSLSEISPANPDEILIQTEQILDQESTETHFLPRQVTLFTDAALLSQLMQVQEANGHQGAWTMEPSVFAQAFQTYWDAGYQIHVQVNGDAAVETLIHTLERQMRRNPRYDHRTTAAHFGMASDEQIKRLASLGAMVAANPYTVTALADHFGTLNLGADRADNLIPLGSAKRAGLPITLRSDMPMAPSKPLYLMWCASSRITSSGRVAGAEQRLTVEDALAAVTINAAYSLRLENDIGSIEPGKLANFTVLDADPLGLSADQINSIGVWGTVLEGRLQPVSRPIMPARTAGVEPTPYGFAHPSVDGFDQPETHWSRTPALQRIPKQGLDDRPDALTDLASTKTRWNSRSR